jgi:hypothetical protein
VGWCLICGALIAGVLARWWLVIILAAMLLLAQRRFEKRGYDERVMFAVYYIYIAICAGAVWLK